MLPMKMTEDFRREGRELLAYSRLWLRKVETLSRWEFTYSKEKPPVCWIPSLRAWGNSSACDLGTDLDP